MAKDVNAFAMANGCIRADSGLMDMMTDNEVEAVIGHEMGHVALGHVKKECRWHLVQMPSAAASAVGSSAVYHNHNSVIWPELVNSQFSSARKTSDDYSYDSSAPTRHQPGRSCHQL
ncbi:M48 family metalloprotease [Escherichia coli]